MVIPIEKDARTYRIAFLGGSAALGFLRPERGSWRILQTMLHAAYPDAKFEVYCLGWNGMNSHVMRHLVEASAHLNIDLYVSYMGNNEIKGTLPLMYDTRRVWTAHPATMSRMIDAYVMLTNLRMLQGLQAFRESWAGPREDLRAWEASAGYDSPNDPRLQIVYNNYEENIRQICDAAKAQGSEIALCTVATNHRHHPPFAPRVSPDLSEEQTLRLEALLKRGEAHQRAGESPDAVRALREARSRALDLNPGLNKRQSISDIFRRPVYL